MKATIGGPLDLAALKALHRPTRPAAVCHACWTTWRASTTAPAVGYCWHGKVAWRIRLSGELETVAASRDEVAAMRRLIGPRT